MPVFVLLDQTGIVTRRISGGPNCAVAIGALQVVPYHPEADPFALPAGRVMCGPDVPRDQLQHGYRTALGYLGIRPELSGQSVSGSVATLPDCPAATVIEIHDTGAGETLHKFTAEVDGFSDTIEFQDAGHYAVEIEPPLPYRPMTLKLEVP